MVGEPRRGTDGLACDVCGQLPHPHRLRLTAVKLGAVLPIELALHALVLALHPPYLMSAVTMAVSTTVLVIWTVEPSAMRLLTGWLHAPAMRVQRDLRAAESLWRVRVTLSDEPGSLERVARELAHLRASILALHVHPLATGVLDEIVVASDADVAREALIEAVRRGGGTRIRIWPTTALSLVDRQTRALDLAARVSHRPEELANAVAELLGAQLVIDTKRAAGPGALDGDPATTLRIPSPWSGLFTFTRPDSPFTPAERARAARLAQIAEATVVTGRAREAAAADPFPSA